MMITGEIVKKGSHYTTMIEALGAYGQGKTREAACASVAAVVLDIVASHRPLDGFKVTVTDDDDATLYLTSNDSFRLASTLLRCQREYQGMSLAAVMDASGAKSRTAYARYEQGVSEPTLGKLQELLEIVAPEFVVAIVPRTARVIPRWDEEADDAEEIEELLRDPTPKNAEALVAKHKRPGRAKPRKAAG
jgi:transcriptional regulator with XRE-family HTH domain